ncbi:hypothetical protein [Bacillus massiliigorillae]|uniref:hypothetical protein n=1 Tax=Bacillus massiliigorillae TaxID=1243664 RepID=UPI0003A6BE6D|nr:hypothetical protein [Bacillus massiliigorillae]
MVKATEKEAYEILEKLEIPFERIDHEDTVSIHPNINTTTLIISFHDLEQILDWSSHPPKYIKL